MLTTHRMAAAFLAGLSLAASGAYLSSQRELLRREMAEHPEQAWPRGSGHIVYAWPGTTEEQKSYVEPGGSFSPVTGSFGLSIEDGESIPISQVHQRFAWVHAESLPVVVTVTPRAESHLLCDRPGHWTILITARASPAVHVAVRSAGPAGGPIRSLENIQGRLLISDRWIVRSDPAPRKVRISEEGPHNEGWLRADLEFGPKVTVEINDLQFGSVPTLPFGSTRALVKIPAVDADFDDCLNAQVAHMMMSLVRSETRPGDPLNYPLPWLRDGAYVVVALARAGQVDTAKQLAFYFASHDFFGGFGAEADAPGLALWALGETSALAHSPEFDRRIWEAVQRKARLIVSMLDAREPMHHLFDGPVTPKYRGRADLTLVCGPAHDGLIAGRMDWHQPLLFVNAVSFLGLNEAAGVADRVSQHDLAAAWRAQAAGIQAAWRRALETETKEADDDRTFISALWPSEIGERDADLLRSLMDARWKKTRTSFGGFYKEPLWTYFELAEAHNWLRLGERERAQQTLQWFWSHQASPGLYTWSEGTAEENTFHRWESIRGWAHPAHVTPHYWTAAEMLLLQLDLAQVRKPGTEERTER